MVIDNFLNIWLVAFGMSNLYIFLSCFYFLLAEVCQNNGGKTYKNCSIIVWSYSYNLFIWYAPFFFGLFSLHYIHWFYYIFKIYLAMEAGYSEKVDELCDRYSLTGFLDVKGMFYFPWSLMSLYLGIL